LAFRERAPSVSVLQTDITHSWDDADIVRRYASKRTLFPFESYLFGKYIPNGSRILDLGVGAGRTTASLADGAKSYVGIDYSPGMVEACRKAFPRLDIRQGDAQNLSAFSNGSMDVVVFSFNGIDYLYPDEARHRCLREVHRVLADGGRFIFSCHNPRGILPTWRLGTGVTNQLRAAYWAMLRRDTWKRLRRGSSRAFLRAGYVRDGVLTRFSAGASELITHTATAESVISELTAFGFGFVEAEATSWRSFKSLTRTWLYYCFERSPESKASMGEANPTILSSQTKPSKT